MALFQPGPTDRRAAKPCRPWSSRIEEMVNRILEDGGEISVIHDGSSPVEGSGR
jgi:hypothetical protein